jgi:raffinose/stachyose/melibiose transport system permease protein
MRFRGSSTLFYLLLIGLIFPYEATVIPLYYVFRDAGLTDSYWALILPQIGLSIPFGTFWMRAFFRSTPTALVEASRLDGASSLGALWRVLLPQAWPAITTMIVLVFMWTWNEFLLALVMIQSDDLRTAPLGLALFAGANRSQDFTLVAASAVLVALPIVVVYIFLQRSFIRGMFAGAVKE